MFPNFGELFSSLDRAEGEAKLAFREFMEAMERIHEEEMRIATALERIAYVLERHTGLVS